MEKGNKNRNGEVLRSAWDRLRGVPFAGEKHEENDFEKLENGLKESDALELLRGRLPNDQESMFGDGEDYVLATNQSGIYSYDQLVRYMDENGGVRTNMKVDGGKSGALSDRFYMPGALGRHSDGKIDVTTSKAEMQQILTTGYEKTMDSFRLVVALPFAVTTEGQWDGLVAREGMMADGVIGYVFEQGMVPEDFYVAKNYGEGNDQHVVNKKYVAGVVDNEGRYIRNTNFRAK